MGLWYSSATLRCLIVQFDPRRQAPLRLRISLTLEITASATAS
jgi:hypothetical protein